MMKVGLTAFGDEKWLSVGRTYDFYRRALAGAFDLTELAEPDIVQASEKLDAIVNFKGSRAWLERGRIACPVLYGMHGGLVVDHAFVIKHLPKLRTCDALLINCSSDEAIVHGWFYGDGPTLVNLPLPVDSSPDMAPGRVNSRRALGIAGDDAVLGFVARLLPAKNLHGFLRMLMQVRRALHSWTVHALVVGNFWLDYPLLGYCTAGYPKYIERLVKELAQNEDLIYFPASLTREELVVVYEAMDVLVHPTYGIDENFGYVPVEAMSRGVPVVAAAYGGLKDTIRDGVTGHLMETWTTSGGIRMDTWGGTSRVVDLLMHPERRAAMAQAARLHAEENYSETRCAEALVTAVREAALNGRDPSPIQLTRKQPAEPCWPRLPLLPEIDRGWFEFEHVVTHYVSSSLPEVRPGDVLSVAAPILLTNGTTVLDDPAWPMSERMDTQMEAVLSKLSVGSFHVVAESWPEREIAQDLVARGWLTVHRAVGAAP